MLFQNLSCMFNWCWLMLIALRGTRHRCLVRRILVSSNVTHWLTAHLAACVSQEYILSYFPHARFLWCILIVFWMSPSCSPTSSSLEHSVAKCVLLWWWCLGSRCKMLWHADKLMRRYNLDGSLLTRKIRRVICTGYVVRSPRASVRLRKNGFSA